MNGTTRVLDESAVVVPLIVAAPVVIEPAAAEEPGPDLAAQAYAAGLDAGQAAALAEARPLLAALATTLEEARTTLAMVGDRAHLLQAATTRTLARDWALAVLAAVWETEAEVRAATVERLLDALPDAATLTVAPEAVPLWTDAAAARLAATHQTLTWRTDPNLTWADVIARWGDGGWWAGLRAALWRLAFPEEGPSV